MSSKDQAANVVLVKALRRIADGDDNDDVEIAQQALSTLDAATSAHLERVEALESAARGAVCRNCGNRRPSIINRLSRTYTLEPCTHPFHECVAVLDKLRGGSDAPSE